MEELLKSDTAKAMGFDNTPTIGLVCNLERLRMRLELVRIAMRTPLYITSGYRCEQLNKAVGGAKHSLHMSGRAADIFVATEHMDSLYNFLNHRDVKGVLGIVELIDHDSYIHVGFRY